MKRNSAIGPLIAICLLGCVASGCSDALGKDNDLSSSLTDYNLVFDEMRIYDQSDAVIIRYVNFQRSVEQFPTIVVGNKPIEVGKAIDLSDASKGSVSRTMANNVPWPDVEQGTLTFTEYGGPGKTAEGEFYVSFVGGGTLNGKFSGTARDNTF